MSGASDRVNLEWRELAIPVPWGVIAAKCYGDQKNPHVLMVHGLLDNAGTFDRLMPFLPDSFNYVNIDLPGHGHSTEFGKGVFLDMMQYVCAIRRVVLHLKWTKYYYIGHSLGGQIGNYYTSLYPDEVIKFVMFDTISQRLIYQETYLSNYGRKIKELIELENKISKSDPPSYTFEEALRRTIENRWSPISEEGAKVLLKRSLRQNKNDENKFNFSNDQRLKLGVTTPMTVEQHMHIVSNIQCPVLLVITSVLLPFLKQIGEEKRALRVLKLLESKSNFEIVKVNGFHDIHNNQPDVVGPIVSRFLLQPKSAL